MPTTRASSRTSRVSSQSSSSPSVSPATAPIVLRLLRKDLSSKNDDIIKIFNVGSDQYRVEYTDPNCLNNVKVHHVSKDPMTGEQMDLYLNSLITLLTRDTDPFWKFQITAPGFPAILLDINDLKKRSVHESISSVLPLLANFWRQ